jgi:hypothetical protein
MTFPVARNVASFVCAGATTAFSIAPCAAPITAVPPAANVARATVEKAALGRLVGPDVPRRTIVLAEPSVTEVSAMREKNRLAVAPVSGTRNGKALVIGFGRDVPAPDRMIDATTLAWVPVADGRYGARVDVRSPRAAALRLGLAMAVADPDVVVRFAGSAPGAAVFAVPADTIAGATLGDGVFWSPILEGDTATLEIVVPAGVDRALIAISIARVAHLAIAGASLRVPTQKELSDIGTAGSCNLDVACVAPSPALSAAASASAQIVFNDFEFVYQCSGTLLNDSLATNTAYFYTANHCISSQARARTINFYWFFDAVACNSRDVPPYVLQAAGATLLARSDDWDWSLVRANGAPPAGALFSAWRAEPLPAASSAIALHYPNGDLEKYSQGIFRGYYSRSSRGSTFATMRWTLGTTEPGSSGAGLFTLGAFGYELRGGLWAGSASCANPDGTDRFSRLDAALPLIRQYLTPTNPSPYGSVAAVEFHHAGLDHYFISTNPAEIDDLDTGAHTGWVRTGFRFLAYPDAAHAPPDASPVCRLYLRPEAGNSHFHSGLPSECAQTAAKYGNTWVYESTAAFYIQLPDRVTGACPAGTQPVYRFFHVPRTNHRYTTEIAVRDDLRADADWIAEGDGPDAVVMCSPVL